MQREVIRRKREIQALERLRGVKLVCDGEVAVTSYRPSRKRLKRDLRKADQAQIFGGDSCEQPVPGRPNYRTSANGSV